MANENETVEQVHDELKRDPLAPNGAKPLTHYLAERILAAHKRELAEQAAVNEAQATQLRDALNECEELKHEIAAKEGKRKGLLKANELLAADNTRLREAVVALRLLAKGLADALKKIDDACDGDMCKHFIDNEHCSKCVYLETCQTGIAHNALETNKSEITKAQEVVE